MMKRTPKIFVVEDSPLDAKVIMDALLKKSYKVVGQASSIEEAMVLIPKRKPDLVLMDITLKGDKDGIRGAAEIQEKMDLPVLFLSGFLNDDIKQRILEAEPSGFLIKPFDEQTLYINIELALYKAAMKKELKMKEIRFQSMLKALPDLLVNYDHEGNYLEVETQVGTELPIGIDNIEKKNVKEVLPDSLANKILLHIDRAIKTGDTQTIEYKLETHKGERLFEMRMVESGFQEVVSIIRDITEARKTEEELIYLRFRDRMTGLYNRDYFEEEIRRLDTERQHPLSVILGDVDGLKIVNDTLGHLEGDKLLKRAAFALSESCREEDVICRVGGDEFIIILPQTNEEHAKKVIARIQTQCEKMTDGGKYVQMALGFATKKSGGKGITKLLKEADEQMYRDKSRNRDEKRNKLRKILEEN